MVEGVAGRRGVQLVGCEVLRLKLGFVHGELLAAHLHGEGLRLGAQPVGCLPDAIGEEIADPFSLADAVQHLDDGLGVAPGEFQAARVLAAYQPVLVALDGEGDGGAGGDRV